VVDRQRSQGYAIRLDDSSGSAHEVVSTTDRIQNRSEALVDRVTDPATMQHAGTSSWVAPCIPMSRSWDASWPA
jgi:hypothetical protein